jgi:hemerythrin superfamily protein
MDLIELMMVEHVSLRVRLDELQYRREPDFFIAINQFVLNCHAKVEDEAVFPRLKAILTGDHELLNTTSKIEADHKLISTLGGNMEKWIKDKDLSLFERRIEVYSKTVVQHNAMEESLVFPFWGKVSAEKARSALEEAKRIINQFGQDRYFEITGVSKHLFNKIWLDETQF